VATHASAIDRLNPHEFYQNPKSEINPPFPHRKQTYLGPIRILIEGLESVAHTHTQDSKKTKKPMQHMKKTFNNSVLHSIEK
jgi:hypothetical protein